MISVQKVGRSLIAGGVAGVIGWLLFIIARWFAPSEAGTWGLSGPGAEQVFAALFGAVFGIALALVEGANTGSAAKMNRALIIYPILGLIGGFLGIFIGQFVYGLMGGGRAPDSGLDFFRQLLARTLGWGMWGVGVGVAMGAAAGIISQSTKRFTLSSTGGALGGLLGGFLFELTQPLGVFFHPAFATLVSFSCLTVAVALFSALALEVFKSAWIKALVGRGEGREYAIDKPEIVIGKDELADIPLFGDQSIERRHAIVRFIGGRMSIEAVGPTCAVLVNGQAVSSSPLKHGDAIRIGSRDLQVFEKGGQKQSAYSAPLPAQPFVSTPTGACQFCGQMKDALGNCQCAVRANPEPVTGGQLSYDTTQVFASPPITGGITLEVVAGPQPGGRYPLQPGTPIVVGRGQDAGIALPADTYMSRNHARITLDQAGGILLEDLGSSNGTYVNGTRVQQHRVNKGDTISVGQTQIKVS